MHKIGTIMWSSIWKDDKFISNINRVEYYGFDFQQQTTINNMIINPGERISTHCVYQRKSDEDVGFGVDSFQEMCIHFLSY